MQENLAKTISVFYSRIMLSGAMLLFLLLGALFLSQYFARRNHDIDAACEQVAERAKDLDSVLSIASDHVLRMKLWSQDYMAMTDMGTATSPLMVKLQYDAQGNYFSLDEAPPKPIGAWGNLWGLGQYKTLPPDIMRELNMALWLSQMQRVTQETNPYFAWSFYLSKHNFAISYPWEPIEPRIENTQNRALRDVFLHAYKGRQWHALIPETNPSGSSMWLDAYVDNSGKGLVITRAAPVYHNKDFLGVVAADIQLTFMERYVNELSYPNEQVFIVTEKGQVLGRTGSAPDAETEVAVLAAVLPEAIGRTVADLASRNRRARLFRSGFNVFIIPLDSAPWTVVQIIPESDISAGLRPQVIFFAVLIAVLTVFLGAAHVLIRNNFIRPVVAFVDFILTEIVKGEASIPPVPPLWRKWFRRVSDALQLKAVAANLPGAMYQAVRHADGKISVPVVSMGVRDLLGLDPEAVAQWETLDLNLLREQDRPEFLRRAEESARTMEPFSFEAAMNLPGGGERWVRFAAQPRSVPRGDVIWDGFMLDISEQKKAEEELREHQTRLEELVLERTIELQEANVDLRREIHERRLNQHELRLSQARLKALSQQVIFSQEQERVRVSRELHDELGQQLTAIAFKIVAMKESNGESEDLSDLEMMLRTLHGELRGICRGLNPVMLDRLGLDTALHMLARELDEHMGLEVQTHIAPLSQSINPETALTIYRVCQEALNNIAKHARARCVSVIFAQQENTTRLEIVDDGVGFSIQELGASLGLGLAGISERAELCGGHVRVHSEPGRGTRIILTIPLSPDIKKETTS